VCRVDSVNKIFCCRVAANGAFHCFARIATVIDQLSCWCLLLCYFYINTSIYHNQYVRKSYSSFELQGEGGRER
jgi:hypothetical protein